MPESRERDKEITAERELIGRMSDQNGGVVEKTIPFANDDVPKYLENLRRFREESRKTELMIS